MPPSRSPIGDRRHPGQLVLREAAYAGGRGRDADRARAPAHAGDQPQLLGAGQQLEDAAQRQVEGAGDQCRGGVEQLGQCGAGQRPLAERGDRCLLLGHPATLGDVTQVDHDALDGRVVEQVGAAHLDVAPAAVTVADPELDAVGRAAGR